MGLIGHPKAEHQSSNLLKPQKKRCSSLFLPHLNFRREPKTQLAICQSLKKDVHPCFFSHLGSGREYKTKLAIYQRPQRMLIPIFSPVLTQLSPHPRVGGITSVSLEHHRLRHYGPHNEAPILGRAQKLPLHLPVCRVPAWQCCSHGPWQREEATGSVLLCLFINRISAGWFVGLKRKKSEETCPNRRQILTTPGKEPAPWLSCPFIH